MGREAASRLEKWELQSYSRRLLPKERVGYCLRHRRPDHRGVEVWHAPARGSAQYGGLLTCGSVWVCPVCAAKIAERRREELAAAVASCRAAGGTVLHAVYTARHARSDALSATLGRFLAAQRSMAGNRAYRALRASCRFLGAVRALEVTWGENGWHPHCHTLLFAPAAIVGDELAPALLAAWSAAAAAQGLTMTGRGLDLAATGGAVDEYVTKWGHEPARRLWEAADELTKAHSKRGRPGAAGGKGLTPFDLLRWLRDTGEAAPARLYREYAGEFKGRRQLTWSPGLRDRLGLGEDQADEQLAAEVREDCVLLALLGPNDWVAVRALDRRGELLEVARAGDPAAVWAFVAECRSAYRRWSRPGAPAPGGATATPAPASRSGPAGGASQ